MSKQAWLLASTGIGVFWAGVTSGIFYFHNQFRIIYSLDTHTADQAVISVIDSAQHYVYFAVYTLTKATIVDALLRARHRGVLVEGITDSQQAKLPEEALALERLRQAGIIVETQKHQNGIMHIKAVVTDHSYASGSYNWTTSATTVNDEILEISSDPFLRQKYLAIIKNVLTSNE